MRISASPEAADRDARRVDDVSLDHLGAPVELRLRPLGLAERRRDEMEARREVRDRRLGAPTVVHCKRACTLDADRRRNSLIRRTVAFRALVKIRRLFTVQA